MLSDIRDSPQFGFLPVDVDSFSRVKEIFDAVDTWLSGTAAQPAMMWIKGGLDVRYDEAFIHEVTAAMASDEDFLEMLTAHSYFADQHDNMDW